MMQATTLDEWTDAMRLRAYPRSNFTYADGDGNVFYLWNAAMPVFPHPYDDTRAVPVTRRDQIWSAMHALDELPQVLNPPGGYVRNENDGPWLTNLRAPLDPADYPAHFEAQGFRLRSQHSALLVGNRRAALARRGGAAQAQLPNAAGRSRSRTTSWLGSVVRSTRARSTSTAVGATTLADALTMLEAWDNTAAPASRGGVLFERWWNRYTDAIEAAYDGDGRPAAVRGRLDARGTHQHAARPGRSGAGSTGVPGRDRGDRDALRCVGRGVGRRAPGAARRGGRAGGRLRGRAGVLPRAQLPHRRRRPPPGRGGRWVGARSGVHEPPRAYSVLAYGQSNREASPYHADQAAMFARGEMKAVAYTRADVERAADRRYRPGLE